MTPVRIASWSNVLPTRTNLVPYREGLFGGGSLPPLIARGGGRSFGDAAYVGGGSTVHAANTAPAIEIAPDLRTVSCDAAAAVGDVQKEVERANRYWPVFGGTQWATAGGAVASDIHSKANPDEGSCGNNVLAISLVTPDGEERQCSREHNPELFAATIGGMGMTGYIRRIAFRLEGPRPAAVRIRAALFENIGQLRSLFESRAGDLQVVEWVDLTRPSPRGILWYAKYTDGEGAEPPRATDMWLPRIRAFHGPSVRLIETITLKAAERLDLTSHRRRFHYGSLHERLKNWNRLFGRRGFIEYHFSVPDVHLEEAFTALMHLRRVHRASVYFAAGKRFGPIPRAGMMSFPMEGWGINFQTPESSRHRRFLTEFTDIVAALGGRVYLAKDAVATARQIERMYPALPAWQSILRRYDPLKKIQSDLSRRLELKPW